MTLVEVTLASGARTTCLGFGCSALVGGRTAAEARALLDAAFDAGIRHFDVARVYGTGDAEVVLGQFAKGHRGELTVATKFGIEPLPQTRSTTAAKRIVRPLLRRSRSLMRLARRQSRRFVTRSHFTPQEARTSLATSLRGLDAPCVEVLLMHDCTAADWQRPDVQATLQDLKASGEIGAYGTATSFTETRTILAGAEPYPAVAQFDSDAINSHVTQLAGESAVGTVITYRCVSQALPALAERLAGDTDLARKWARALDVDVRSREVLGSLLLCHAVRSNRSGITLFSSGDPARIQRNVEAVSENAFEDAQLDEFALRARTLLLGGSGAGSP
jgi:D-threo-aldose 1-dehydrogenase